MTAEGVLMQFIKWVLEMKAHKNHTVQSIKRFFFFFLWSGRKKNNQPQMLYESSTSRLENIRKEGGHGGPLQTLKTLCAEDL